MAKDPNDKQTQGDPAESQQSESNEKTAEELAAELEKGRNPDQEQALTRKKNADKKGKKAKKDRKSHVVAEGKSVTTKRGIVDDANERGVDEDDFPGGKDTLKELVERGIVKKR